MIFNNRRLFHKQQIEILDSSLHITSNGLFDSIEYEQPFDNVTTSRIVEVSANNSAFVASFFCFIVTLFMIFVDNLLAILIFGLITIVAFFFGLFTRVKKVTIPVYNSSNIILYFNRNNKQEVVEFADLIISSVNSYLRNKYSKFDNSMPLEKQFDNLHFLREREIISEEEFEGFKAYLLGKEKKSIGFGK